ncbi:MAG: cyclic nucleotide-binding domain-containing protein [Verrucomicrobia bacterium]|jgi:CRP/FNR family transcriptional regulator, cyclic AMP receptor protein|nr:cyclic nucleotide-binding domain-containing protein [Verrucomicrobiota bacterium]
MNTANHLSDRSNSIRLATDATSEDIANLLLSLPIFENLERKEVAILSRHFKLYAVDAGAVLFAEGDTGDFMAIVVSGSADLSKGTEDGSVRSKFATAGSGKLLGEMALIDGEPRSASAAFEKSARILVLSRESFESIISQYEKAGIALLWRLCRNISHRLRQTTGMLLDSQRMQARH